MSRQSNQRINQLGHLLLQVGALVRRGGTFCTMIASAAKAGRYALLACAFTTLFGATAQAQTPVPMTGLKVTSPILTGQTARFGVEFDYPFVGGGTSKTVSFTYTFPAGVVIAATPDVKNDCDPASPNLTSGSFTAPPGGNTWTVTNFTVGNGFRFCRMNINVTSATPATYSLPVSALTATSGFTISGTATGASLVVNGRPTLTKAFSPTTIGVGSPSTLTFTITNPASVGAASGLTFTDTFPAGMVIAATPNVVNSCGGSPTITATAGAGSIVVGGTGVNAAAGPSTCTVTVQVTSQTAGFYLNGAGQMVTSTSLFNGVTNQILTVTQAGLTAAFNPTSIGQGETSTLTFTLTNGAGNLAQSGINFTNSLPTGVTVAASPSIASTCPSGVGAVAATGGGSSITVTGASMSAGQATCTISVPVTSRVVGTYTNTAARFASLARVTNNVVNTTLTVTAKPTLTKTIRSIAGNSLVGGVGLNANLTWTIVLPSGFSTISGIGFNDTVPTGMVIAPVSIGADCGTPTVTATAGGTTIAVSNAVAIAGRTCGITVQVVPAIEAPATYPSLASTIANLTPTIFNGAVDETYQTTQAGLTAAFTPTSIGQGETSTLTFTLTNGAGNPAQSGINFTNNLPTGVVVAASPAVSNTCGGSPTIAAGAGAGFITVTGALIGQWTASCTISVAVTSSVAGTFTNNTSRFASVARVTNAVNTTLTVTPKVSLFMSFVPTFVAKSQPARLQFDLVNPSVSAGGSNQTGVGFTNNLPTGVVVANPPAVSNSCGGTVTAGAGGTTIALAGVSMLAGTNCILSVAVTSATAGVYQNTPQRITAVTPNVFNNTTTQTLTVWEAPTASVSFAATNLALNGTTTMTISVTNPSPNTVAMTGVGFTNTYPTGLTGATTATITGTGCTGTLTATTGSLALTGGTVPPNTTCSYSVVVTGTTAGAKSNSVTVTSANAPSATAAATTVNVYAPPTVAKAFSPASIGVGATTALTYTFTNPSSNPGNVTGIAVSDFFPTSPGAMTLSNTTVGGTCTPVTVLNQSGGALASGNTGVQISGISLSAGQSCTVTVNVTAGIAGSYNSTTTAPTASAAAGTVALTGVGAAASVPLTVVQASVAKTFGATSINDGGTTSLVFTLTNGTGTPAQSGLAVGDTLPSSLRLNSTTPSVTYSFGCTGPLTAQYNASTRVMSGLTGVAMSIGTATCTVTVAGLTNVATQTNTTCTPNQPAFTNLATNVSTTRLTNTSIDQCLVVTQSNATLTKSWGEASIADGTPTTLVFTLTNTGSNPAQSGIGFTESLPTGLRFTSAAPAVTFGAGCSGTSSVAQGTPDTVTFSNVGINAGTNICTITVNGVTNRSGQINTSCPVASPPAAFTNTAEQITVITGVNNGVTPQCLVVTAQSPAIAKAFSPSAIAAGATSTMSFTITNPNSVALTGANFTDTLVNMSVAGAQTITACGGSNSLTNGQTALSFTGLTIPAAGTCTINVTVTSSTPGVLPNTASGVASAQAATGTASNTVNLTVYAAPTIAKAFVTPTIAVGGTSQINFTITNPNSVALTGANFTDTLTNMFISATGSATGSCVGASTNSFTAGQTGLITIGGLTIPAKVGSVNGSCTVSIVVQSNTPGTHSNQANAVFSNEAPPSAPSNTANLTVTAQSPTISMGFQSNPIGSGATSKLTITINNPNAVSMTVTSLTNNFPTSPGTGLVRASTPNPSTTCGGVVAHSPSSVTLTGGSVPANGSCTVQIDVTAASSGSYENTIPVDALKTGLGNNTTAAAATLTVSPVANVSVTKTGPATIAWGTTLTYTVVVANAGPDAANLTTLTDSIPAALTGVTAGCGGAVGDAVCGAVTFSGNTLTSAITALPASSSVTFTITGTAPGNGTLNNKATAIVPLGIADPDDLGRTGAGNNTSATVTTVVNAPDLTIAKTPFPSIFTVGTNAFFTLTPSNVGTSATSGGITVVDTLPTGLSYVSAGSGGTDWGCVVSGQVVTCTSTGIINAGGTGNPITINVQVLSTAVPSVTNSVTISGGGEPAANISNNSALAIVSVSSAPVNTFFPSGARSGPPGSAVFYPHTFAAGIAGAVAFSASRTADPNIPGWGVQLYRDNNCNAVLDDSDGTVEISGTPFTVLVGGQVCLIVKSNIPITAPEGVGAKDVISVTAAFTPSGGAVATLYGLVDTTTVGGGLGLVKSVKNVTQAGSAGTSNSAKPGDELEYEITYSSGLYALTKIVVSDQIPAYATLVDNSAGCVVPLPNDITTCTVKVTGATATITWTLAGTLSPSQTGKVSFRVKVNQ